MTIQERLQQIQQWARTGVILTKLPSSENYGSEEFELALFQYCYYRLIDHVAGNIIENPNYDVHELVDVFLSSPFGNCVTKDIVISLCELLMSSALRPYCTGTLFASGWTADDVAGAILSRQGGTVDLLKAAKEDYFGHKLPFVGNSISVPSNPWVNLSMSGDIIADCDKKVINNWKDKHLLKLHLYPEPYVGSPDADVYLLNGNPGYHKRDDLFVNDKDYRLMMENNYKHQSLSPKDDFIYYNEIKDADGSKHEGCLWWEKNTKELKAILNRNPRFFNIEYFPYHSEKLDKIPRLNDFLPSYEYTNFLIEKAIEEGKTIVILRLHRNWKERIPALNRYNKVITLNSSQKVCITPNNVSGNWQELIDRL